MQRDASACHPEHSIKIDNMMRERERERHIIYEESGGGGCIELCIRAY